MTQAAVREKFLVTPSRLWERVGTFASLGDWSPAVERYECDGDTPGSVRTLHVAGGGVIVEKLVEMKPQERFYTYTIEESPLPVKDYRSTIKVQDDGGGTCTVDWSSTFEPVGATELEVIKIIEGIYHSGLDALKKELSG